MHILLRRALPLALLLFSSSVNAQLIGPIRYNEGPGIKLGESLVFHPGIALGGGYDSNVRFAKSADGAGFLRVLPHIDLATLSPQRKEDSDTEAQALPVIDFRLSGALSYREYFSSNDKVSQWRAFEVDAGMMLKLFPGRLFSAELFDEFVRSYPNWSGDPSPRDSNRGGLRLILAPGGGLLNFSLGYSINLHYFEDDDKAFARKYFHEVNFRAKWRLLPQSAVFLDVIQQFHDYFDSSLDTLFVNQDSMPLRIFLGYNGLLTPRFGVLLKIGYGNSFHDNGPSYNLVIGQAEISYYIGPFAKIKLGFEHRFDDSFFFNYFMDEKVYLGYDHLIINRILAHVQGEYRYRSYYGEDSTQKEMRATNHIVSLDVGLDYKIRDWIDLGVSYNLGLRDLASFEIANVSNAQYFVDDYVKHQVMGKIEVAY